MSKKNFKINIIMELYNTIKILPNIYLSNNYHIDNNFIENNFISNIIVINNIIDNQSDNYNKINISLNETNIDFNTTNNMIIDIIKKSKNILIISEKNIIGFVIISAFLISNLNITLLQILILNKYYNIEINKTNYFKLLQKHFYLHQ